MNFQILQDTNGKDIGIFIPIDDWEFIKNEYPDIENTTTNLEQSKKDFINIRLDAIDNNSDRLLIGENLFKALKKII